MRLPAPRTDPDEAINRQRFTAFGPKLLLDNRQVEPPIADRGQEVR